MIASGLFSGETLSVLKSFGAEEDEHVDGAQEVAMSLGTPATKPTGKFPLNSAAAGGMLAAAVENLGAAAYLGQAPGIQSKEILAAALAIHIDRGAPRGDAQHPAQEGPDPRRRVRQADERWSRCSAVVKPFIA